MHDLSAVDDVQADIEDVSCGTLTSRAPLLTSVPPLCAAGWVYTVAAATLMGTLAGTVQAIMGFPGGL